MARTKKTQMQTHRACRMRDKDMDAEEKARNADNDKEMLMVHAIPHSQCTRAWHAGTRGREGEPRMHKGQGQATCARHRKSQKTLHQHMYKKRNRTIPRTMKMRCQAHWYRNTYESEYAAEEAEDAANEDNQILCTRNHTRSSHGHDATRVRTKHRKPMHLFGRRTGKLQ